MLERMRESRNPWIYIVLTRAGWRRRARNIRRPCTFTEPLQSKIQKRSQRTSRGWRKYWLTCRSKQHALNSIIIVISRRCYQVRLNSNKGTKCEIEIDKPEVDQLP